MKKISLLLVAVVLCSVSGFAADATDTYSVDRSDLPQPAQDFLKEYFPKARVGMVKTDKHLFKKTDYDVKLTNGTKIEFDNAGKWTSVDCKTAAVPSGIIPKTIRNYVSKNFSDVKIVKIEKSASKYEVDLSDGVELTFNPFGQFRSMKIDD